jgi:tight adherence protein B
MRRRAGALLVALAIALVLAAQATAATTLSLTQLPGAQYPQVLYLLTSSTSLSTTGGSIGVTENGKPVGNLSIMPSGTAGQPAGGQAGYEYTISYRSAIAKGTPVTVAVSAPGGAAATASYTDTGLSLPAAAVPSTSSNSGFLRSTAAVVIVSVIVALLIGLAVFAGAYRRSDVGGRVGEFVTPVAGPLIDARMSLAERALGDMRTDRLTESPFSQQMLRELDVARIELPPQAIIVSAVVGTAFVAWLGATQTGSVVGVLFGLTVPFAVYYTIRALADRQRRLFDEQLPDNLGVVAAAMRAGHTFAAALNTVVGDAPEPSRAELNRATTDERLGVPLDEALGRVTARMGSEDFHHVAIVASLQRETGGNTAEVIDLVNETIRERLEIRRLVRSLTAQGRMAGLVLSLLPVGMLVALSLINPRYMHPMYHDTIGVILLIVSGILMLIGGFLIKQIITIKV